jgi:hypothetical protein
VVAEGLEVAVELLAAVEHLEEEEGLEIVADVEEPVQRAARKSLLYATASSGLSNV